MTNKNPLDIECTLFRAISTVNGNIMCSRIEEVSETSVKIFHPYWLYIDNEEGELVLTCLDPWNPEDFILMSLDKILFVTKVDHVFSSEFRTCLKQRILDDSQSETEESIPKTSENVVSILGSRRKMN